MTNYRFNCSSEPPAFPPFESPFDDDRAALLCALQKIAGPANIGIEVSAGERYVSLVSLRTTGFVPGEQLGSDLVAGTSEAITAGAFDRVLAGT